MLKSPLVIDDRLPVPMPGYADELDTDYVSEREPAPFDFEGLERDEASIAHAIARMLREGRAAVSLPLAEIHLKETQSLTRTLRLREGPAFMLAERALPECAADLSRFTEGRSVMFAAVGELKRSGDTATLVVTLLQAPAADQAPTDQAGLPKWRLKRAVAYIEARLSGPISVQAVAEAAGLSPAYFGAQFRIATGFRPHQYIIRKRIQRAQEMLLDPVNTVIEIALSVGFQTQAHFTTVFRKYVGDTPFQWRQRNLVAR